MPYATCVKLKLHYFPVPKNAGTSIRDCLFEIENGWRYRPMIIDGQRIGLHKLFGVPGAFQPAPDRPGYLRFAVVRDPLRRLLSAYASKVLDRPGVARADFPSLGLRSDLPKDPDIETFVAHLDEYRAITTIGHHTNPQRYFLGGDLAHFHRVFRAEDLGELEHFLSERAGAPITLPRLKGGGPKVDLATLSPAARGRIVQHYAADYELLARYYAPV
jgi:hypothetical protein